jgi:hypothetical protein
MATNVRLMITLTDANTTYTLANRLTAAGFAGLPAFRSLSYFTPGSDYATPNTDNVTIGESGLTSKTASGFTLNSSNAASTATVEWFLVR